MFICHYCKMRMPHENLRLVTKEGLKVCFATDCYKKSQGIEVPEEVTKKPKRKYTKRQTQPVQKKPPTEKQQSSVVFVDEDNDD